MALFWTDHGEASEHEQGLKCWQYFRAAFAANSPRRSVGWPTRGGRDATHTNAREEREGGKRERAGESEGGTEIISLAVLSTYIILIHERTSFSLLLRHGCRRGRRPPRPRASGLHGGGGGDKSWQTFLFFSRFLEKSWRQLRKKMRKVKEAGKEGWGGFEIAGRGAGRPSGRRERMGEKF